MFTVRTGVCSEDRAGENWEEVFLDIDIRDPIFCIARDITFRSSSSRAG
jgi:hypothetical protein